MILADENIDARLISALRSSNIVVSSIKEDHPGVKDEEVISLSKNPPTIILTEDKDFGEWVYSHNDKEISVILMRYHSSDINRIIPILLNLITTKGKGLFGKFTTITINKIRIRSL